MTRLDESRDAPPLPPVRRRFDVKLWIASLVIACGLALVGIAGFRAVTPGSGTALPDAIEVLDPPPNALQVPSQTQILVDLADGYTGRLVIDGVEYETIDLSQLGRRAEAPEPGTQVDVPAGAVFDEGRNSITFRPGSEVGFDEFAEGNRHVVVYYWRIVDGEETAQRFSWTFNVV